MRETRRGALTTSGLKPAVSPRLLYHPLRLVLIPNLPQRTAVQRMRTSYECNRNRDGYIPVAGEAVEYLSITDIPREGVLHVHPDGTYTYAYGPTGIAGLVHNYYALGCAVFASIGGLTFGYDQGVIANVLVMKDFVGRWHLSAWDTGLMSACLSRASTRRTKENGE
ncbi:hypothetical protein BD311DRAFT_146026 [Dichomitus squalens]|uniref:Uncharacterized protein n=1 Tax=Dichomitus squalens TaxID=114155 RepID=A0A4Q9MTC2_9APHY|nr:hypothetical protein BD311DRAFT_146026 [Dichomitus squalens]